MCKWLSAATMVNMDKNNTISTNNMGREIGDFLSDEIFFPNDDVGTNYQSSETIG